MNHASWLIHVWIMTHWIIHDHMSESWLIHTWHDSHTWINHDHMSESCQVWMSHVLHINESWSHERVMTHIHTWHDLHTWINHDHMSESCQVWMSHVSYINESSFTHKWVLIHTWMNHDHMSESWLIHTWHDLLMWSWFIHVWIISDMDESWFIASHARYKWVMFQTAPRRLWMSRLYVEWLLYVAWLIHVRPRLHRFRPHCAPPINESFICGMMQCGLKVTNQTALRRNHQLSLRGVYTSLYSWPMMTWLVYMSHTCLIHVRHATYKWVIS